MGSHRWVFQRTHYWTPKIQGGGHPPSWKLTWRYFSAVGSPIWLKFQSGAEWHADCGNMVKTETRSRIPIWQTVVFFETRNNYVSATDWVITTKFGLLIETDIRKRMTSPDLKLEVKLHCSIRHLGNWYHIISALRLDRFGWNSAA